MNKLKLNEKLNTYLRSKAMQFAGSLIENRLKYRDPIYDVSLEYDGGSYLSLRLGIRGHSISLPPDKAIKLANNILEMFNGVEDTTDGYRVMRENYKECVDNMIRKEIEDCNLNTGEGK